MRNEEFFDINVGNAIIRVGFMGAAGIIGVVVIGELKDVFVDKLTEAFGKYQGIKDDSATKLSEINDTQRNILDVAPDADEQLPFTDDDLPKDNITIGVQQRQAKFDSLAQNQTIKTTDAEETTKRASTDELISRSTL